VLIADPETRLASLYDVEVRDVVAAIGQGRADVCTVSEFTVSVVQVVGEQLGARGVTIDPVVHADVPVMLVGTDDDALEPIAGLDDDAPGANLAVQ
jgi:hypothetical protein